MGSVSGYLREGHTGGAAPQDVLSLIGQHASLAVPSKTQMASYGQQPPAQQIPVAAQHFVRSLLLQAWEPVYTICELQSCVAKGETVWDVVSVEKRVVRRRERIVWWCILACNFPRHF